MGTITGTTESQPTTERVVVQVLEQARRTPRWKSCTAEMSAGRMRLLASSKPTAVRTRSNWPRGLEFVPRKQIAYKGVTVEETDTDAVIKRNPAVALADEIAHNNAPGSVHEKRWQDVEDILNTGITVVSTINIQQLESLADIVESITGVHVRERCDSACAMATFIHPNAPSAPWIRSSVRAI
jgi:hypothetical protein